MAGILIIDDDASIRAMFARALQALGEVEVAANGADALRLLAGKQYGVLLLDLHMPVVDGFALLQGLAAKPGPNRDAPVYVITADTSDQARIRALRRHAVFFLSKPVPIATLTALVDATLKKGAARAARAEGPCRRSELPAAGAPGLRAHPPDLPAPPGREHDPAYGAAAARPFVGTPRKPGADPSSGPDGRRARGRGARAARSADVRARRGAGHEGGHLRLIAFHRAARAGALACLRARGVLVAGGG